MNDVQPVEERTATIRRYQEHEIEKLEGPDQIFVLASDYLRKGQPRCSN